MDAVNAMNVPLGPRILLSYVLQYVSSLQGSSLDQFNSVSGVLAHLKFMSLRAEGTLVPFCPDLGELSKQTPWWPPGMC